MRNLGIEAFFLIWRKNTLNVDLGGEGGGGKYIYIYIYIYICVVKAKGRAYGMIYIGSILGHIPSFPTNHQWGMASNLLTCQSKNVLDNLGYTQYFHGSHGYLLGNI